MSKLFLKPEDRIFLEKLKFLGVLTRLDDPAGLDMCKSGIHIGLSCPDGHQALELQEAHFRATGCQLHIVGDVHGGAAAISPSCVLHDEEDTFPHSHYVYKMLSASKIKEAPVVHAYVHFPCGQATAKRVNGQTLIELQMLAVKGLAEASRKAGYNLIFKPSIHIDWGFGEKRSYNLAVESWEAVRGTFADQIFV
jgi:hypothetical protein